ncbi:LysR substrate-binding domain-containing protein [Vibrio sp. OPT18]|uniref:LysR substrate-binding domain-containing protein n=1 Tax=Vibrio sp. OPT18 TaxID=2778641 RepID=UPI001881815E|nr:LysR substrate-binding domain-containing protein [Vibrio sp. OPT18]MBE8575278.1 LysR family transcriptional regulator [Vibrio sp. OPT18]
MDVNQLTKCDLNLLICLYVLLEEKNVSRTAQRLHLTQSAVSKNLARLREWFDDPLFFRLSKGLSPTHKAETLRPIVSQILELSTELSKPTIFEPSSTPRHFNLALIESIYPLLLPKFLGEVFGFGSHLTIDTFSWDNHCFEKLSSGEVDFGITGKELNANDIARIAKIPQDIEAFELYRESQCCLIREEHPVLEKEWNMEAYIEAQHIQVRCGVDDRNRWLLDFKLAERGLYRMISTTVDDFNNAASLATCTDLVLTAPKQFAAHISKQLRLTIRPLPVELPEMAYTLFWSRNHESDPSHKWLRELIISRCTS